MLSPFVAAEGHCFDFRTIDLGQSHKSKKEPTPKKHPEEGNGSRRTQPKTPMQEDWIYMQGNAVG
jgi:hypothetical protein